MGEAWFLLVARRGGWSGEAATRCPAIISETPNSRCQVLPGGHIVSSQQQLGLF